MGKAVEVFFSQNGVPNYFGKNGERVLAKEFPLWMREELQDKMRSGVIDRDTKIHLPCGLGEETLGQLIDRGALSGSSAVKVDLPKPKDAQSARFMLISAITVYSMFPSEKGAVALQQMVADAKELGVSDVEVASYYSLGIQVALSSR